MAPIRIRYHVPVSPAISVIRYNDPVKERHRKRHNHRAPKHHKLRENRSDFDYDYGPRHDDFEHMRRSVPDKYWGPYNPYIYNEKKHWDTHGDDKYYDFKYDSYHKYASEEDFRGDYDSEPPRAEHRRYEGGYETDTWPPLERHDRGHHAHRPVFDSDYGREYFSDRRPVGGSYDRNYDRYHRYAGREYHGYNDYNRRPKFVQSEIVLPSDRWRPLPYLGDPNRKPHEHRRRLIELPPQHHSYHNSPRRYNGGHRKHAHFLPPRSDSPDTYITRHVYMDDKTLAYTEPRVALLKKRHKKGHQYGYCDASPEKSSKYIPTMHYDELRCPNCQDKVQSFEDEVLAYPWTVQTFRPQKQFSKANASVITPSVFDNTVMDKKPHKTNGTKSVVANKSETKEPVTGNGQPPSKVNSIAPKTKEEGAGKENNKEKGTKKSKDQKTKPQPQKDEMHPLSDTGNVAPSEPLFRANSDVVARSKVEERSLRDRLNPQEKASIQRKPGLETVHEGDNENDKNLAAYEGNGDFDDYDDIRPQDSISNVRLPPLRAYPTGPNNTGHRRISKARAETEVTPYSYPSGRYFPAYEFVPPPPAQATPLPRREDALDPSRRLRGRYYDRRKL
ncbi:hypothetical protein PoB_000322600 [Plakobranchus ocellatus]|uniref:Uncharacterized protein n=1 Tax=Plakobranchus ocellatus TaxID=259542 RepID=A0AAV3Y2N6_9GAST|nr:hypothetical protein PoB_000322600 [Plakobranchus ocellatus]